MASVDPGDLRQGASDTLRKYSGYFTPTSAFDSPVYVERRELPTSYTFTHLFHVDAQAITYAPQADPDGWIVLSRDTHSWCTPNGER
jgi:hypothetical protein